MNVSGGSGVTVGSIVVSSSTSLTANFVLDFTATGPRSVTVTTAAGTSGAQTFTVNPPPAGAPTLTGVAPDQGIQGTTVAVTLTGTNFIVGATTVNIGGGGVTVNSVVVGSTTSLTANFVLDPDRGGRCSHGDGHDGHQGAADRGSSRSACHRRALQR